MEERDRGNNIKLEGPVRFQVQNPPFTFFLTFPIFSKLANSLSDKELIIIKTRKTNKEKTKDYIYTKNMTGSFNWKAFSMAFFYINYGFA